MEMLKIGAVIVKNHKLLVVRKRKNPSHYIIPGGKPEAGESPRQAIIRELREELSVEVDALSFIGRYATTAIFEDAALTVQIYEADVSGDPTPGAEIDDFQWIGADYEEQGFRVGSVLSDFVIPYLTDRGRL